MLFVVDARWAAHSKNGSCLFQWSNFTMKSIKTTELFAVPPQKWKPLLWNFTLEKEEEEENDFLVLRHHNMKWISHEREKERNYSAKFIFMSSNKRPWNWSWSHFNEKEIKMLFSWESSRFLSTAVLFHSSCFASDVRMMAIIKINLKETPEWAMSVDDVIIASNTLIPIHDIFCWWCRNPIALELHEM